MTEVPNDDSSWEPGVSDQRFLVEVLSWDWNLSVALSSDLTPAEYRFQGGLNYVRTFVVLGRVLAPETYRGKNVRVWVSPFGPDMRFGPDELDEVGRFYFRPTVGNSADLEAMLMLPEAAVATTAVSLNSVSKFLWITIFDVAPEQASVSGYGFMSAPPDSVKHWTPDEQG